jgi:hypothetical protein
VRLLPTNLFKYQAWSKHSAEILSENKLWFSSPRQLNDPRDCRPDFDFSGPRATQEDALRRYAIEERIPDLVGYARRAVAKQPINWGPVQESVFRGLERVVGLLCLAPSASNDHMWRNYAAEYTGYCLQFATACVGDPDAFDERERRPKFRFCTCEPVEYPDDLTPVPWNLQDVQQEYELLFLRKAAKWQPEAEWRRLDWNAQGGQTGPGYHWYAPQQLTAVVVGGEMPEHLRTQLIERVATRGRAIKILEALQPQVGEVPELREVCAVGVA